MREVAITRGVAQFRRVEVERIVWACGRLVVDATALIDALALEPSLADLARTAPQPRITPQHATHLMRDWPDALRPGSINKRESIPTH